MKEHQGIPEDRVYETLSDLIKHNRRPIHYMILKGIDAVAVFLFVKVFGGLAYDRKYLKGKWFKKFWSSGWRWAFNGMFGKLFTGAGRGVPWPISSQCVCSKNVDFHIDDINNFQGLIYYQTFGDARIVLGRGVSIARGCALITTNHDLLNPAVHTQPQSIEIGDNCWLGTNSVIMPGVILGPHTVVGANAVVTSSFPDGYGVLVGVPARLSKTLPKSLG